MMMKRPIKGSPIDRVAKVLGISPQVMKSPELQPALIEMHKADLDFGRLFFGTPKEERRTNSALMQAATRRRNAIAAVHAILNSPPTPQ